MTVSRVLIATRNPGKLAELVPMLAAAGITGIGLEAAGIEVRSDEDEIECFDTFEENARAKALYFVERSDGIPTIADDSGLEVAALEGRPGVHSKRWSGRCDLHGAELDAANNAVLLAALAGHQDRSARYVCVATYADGETVQFARGESAGRILHEPRGEGGFGYDPLFESTELQATFAEADPAAKAQVSHRGRALRALMSALARAR
ncbi:MAG TPA: non-canonical purine NTP pyrophosphatase [Gemmatimonadaceae bacterium]|nr:non-canonical purine NTP pyrophosphatase [Gemmatimonadaceae bacterium]